VLGGYLQGRSAPLPQDSAALRARFALEPYSDAEYAALRDAGAHGLTLERWRFEAQRVAGDVAGALATARRLMPALSDFPLERGRVWLELAGTFAAAGDGACAAAAQALADRIPGIDVRPAGGAAACSRALR